MQRLDKIISSQFNISRSVARAEIRRGKVCVDNDVVRDFSAQFDPTACDISYRGQALSYKKHIYIIMNKPRGVLSASTDKSRETVVDLVREDLKRTGLFPVGRLDKDTTGLLLITDDGEFAHKVISPKKNITKTYLAELDGPVTDRMVKIFAEGVTLADGAACRTAELTPLENNCAIIKITEGKYHQIKRMFGTVELGVNSLHRMALGSLTLPGDLDFGDSRELTKAEIEAIFGN